MIELKDVTKVYQMGEVEVHALRGVSLQIGGGRWWPSWVPLARANPR